MRKPGLLTLLFLFLPAGTAHAGPLIGAIVAAASAISSTAIGGMLISAGLSYGLNYLYQKFFGEEIKVQGIRQRLETGGDKPLSFLWGTTATAGKLVYFNEYGEEGSIKNLWLTMVIGLSDLPINGLSNYIWVNGERCTIKFNETNSDGFHPVEEYYKGDNQYLYVKFYDGTQTSADPFLVSTYGSDPTRPWKDDMIGRGEPYVIINASFSRRGLWSGVPTFLFPVRGIPLYDLRKDSTVPGGSGSQRWSNPSTWTWTDNLAVAKYNFIRGVSYKGKWLWGGQKVNAYRLPAENWIAAMNVCDQPIVKKDGTTIKRYTGGGEISINTPPITIVNEIDKSSSAHTSELGGIFKTWVAEPGLSVYSFTDDDIIITESQEDDLFKPIQDTFNAATATYTEPKRAWALKDAPGFSSAIYEAEDDNQELIADLSFPMVYESNQAQRLERELVRDSRRQATHIVQMGPKAWVLEVFDMVNWTSVRNGYTSKKFIVVSIDDLANCNQLVSLREVNPADFGWIQADELDSSVEPISQVKPPPFNNVYTVAPGAIKDSSGDRRPAIKLMWDWADKEMDVSAIQFQVRLAGDTEIIHRGRTDDPTDGLHKIHGGHILADETYKVRARAIPITPNRDSEWSSWLTISTSNIRLKSIDIEDRGVARLNIEEQAISRDEIEIGGIEVLNIAENAVSDLTSVRYVDNITVTAGTITTLAQVTVAVPPADAIVTRHVLVIGSAITNAVSTADHKIFIDLIKPDGTWYFPTVADVNAHAFFVPHNASKAGQQAVTHDIAEIIASGSLTTFTLGLRAIIDSGSIVLKHRSLTAVWLAR